MCGVWCVVCGVNLPFWLKFKWRMAHSLCIVETVERGTANRPPHSRFAVWWCNPSPPFTSSSTPSPRCLLHFERLRVNTTHSILPSIHTSTSATSLPPPLRLNTLPSTLPSIHTCTSAISLPRPLRLNTLHYILHPSAPPPRAPPRPPSTPPTAPPSPRRRSRGARRAPRRRSLRRHC